MKSTNLQAGLASLATILLVSACSSDKDSAPANGGGVAHNPLAESVQSLVGSDQEDGVNKKITITYDVNGETRTSEILMKPHVDGDKAKAGWFQSYDLSEVAKGDDEDGENKEPENAKEVADEEAKEEAAEPENTDVFAAYMQLFEGVERGLQSQAKIWMTKGPYAGLHFDVTYGTYDISGLSSGDEETELEEGQEAPNFDGFSTRLANLTEMSGKEDSTTVGTATILHIIGGQVFWTADLTVQSGDANPQRISIGSGDSEFMARHDDSVLSVTLGNETEKLNAYTSPASIETKVDEDGNQSQFGQISIDFKGKYVEPAEEGKEPEAANQELADEEAGEKEEQPEEVLALQNLVISFDVPAPKADEEEEQDDEEEEGDDE